MTHDDQSDYNYVPTKISGVSDNVYLSFSYVCGQLY